MTHPRMALLLLTACVPEDTATPATDHVAPGPYAVGHTRRLLDDPARDRALTVEIWYPARTPSPAVPVPEAFFPEGPDRDAWADLVSAAPPGCVTREAPAAGGPPLTGTWPGVLFSHCHACVRFSSFSLAGHLASHGWLVVAPDHAGNTLPDALAGAALPLDDATLQLRLGDQVAVLDAALSGGLLPDGVQLDPARVAAAGHSFGSVTTGLFVQEDGRPAAALALAAPMENPLLSGVRTASLGVPTAFVLAEEDGSIGAPGNALLEADHARAAPPSWLLRLPDAGHWSVTDLAGLTPDVMAGCGSAPRQLDPRQTVTFPPASGFLGTTRAFAAAFLAATLGDDPSAIERLDLGAALSTRRVDP